MNTQNNLLNILNSLTQEQLDALINNAQQQQQQQPQEDLYARYKRFNEVGFIKNNLTVDDLRNELFYEMLYKYTNADMLADMIEDKAKTFGKTKFFREQWKKQKQKEKEKRQQQLKEEAKMRGKQLRNTEFSDLPDFCTGNKLMPEEWTCNNNEIRRDVINGKTIKSDIACGTPILINRIFKPINGIDDYKKAEVIYRNEENEWKKLVFSLSDLISSECASALSNNGVLLPTSRISTFNDYMTDMYESNRGSFEVVKTVENLGYNKDFSLFVPYVDMEYNFEKQDSYPELMENLKPHGDKEAWYDKFRELRKAGKDTGYLPLRVTSAAALAGFIMPMLSVDNFLVNLYGTSSTGKTVNQLITSSIYCNPHTPEIMTGANTTDVALELRLDTLKSFPILIEDLSELSDKGIDNFRKTVMSFCNGRGKARGTKSLTLRKTSSWKTTAILTSEKKIADNWGNAGSHARMLNLENEDKPPYFNQFNEIISFCEENYGHCSRDFVKKVIEIGQLKIREMVNNKYQELLKIARKKDKNSRQAMNLAIILVADEIATKYLFKDDIFLTIDEVEVMMDDMSTISQEERFYEKVCSIPFINRINFEGLSSKDDVDVFWGIYKEADVINGKVHKTLCYSTLKLKELAIENGVDLDLFLKWLIKKELLIADKGRYQKNTKKHGRVYKFIIRPTEEEIEEEKKEIEETDKFILENENKRAEGELIDDLPFDFFK